ncbi:hypothetical protein LguiA_010200 [Lonicera macranthoides]
MPPRVAKKATGPGTKRKAKSARATPKKNPAVAEESLEVEEEIPVEVKEEVKVHQVVEETKPVDDKAGFSESEVVPKPEEKSEENGTVFGKKEDEVKESVEEYEKGERLELEENEPEEYDLEQDDVHEEGDELEEEADEGEFGEEEEVVVEEEIEDVPEEEHGGEEDEEHGDEEPNEMVAAEEQEHHDVFKERRKRKEFEIFVGGLDKDAAEDELRKVFSKVGEITEVRLMMNPQTKKNKGFAFLRFATVEQAKRACAELKRPVVHGKQCGVTPSQDNDTLFLGNICKTWTQEALKDKLKHCGVDAIEDLTLVEDSNSAGMNRGFAFLEFSSRSDAMDAFKRLQKRDVAFGIDRPAKVSFADSFIDPGDEIMVQVKTVFVDGLPVSWDEDKIRGLLMKYGGIEKIELARNMPSAKRRDFGFISFDSHDAAVTCAKSINNQELGDGDNKAKVRARLSRPLHRGKGKHISRGDFRPGHSFSQGFRGPWGRPVPHSLPVRGARGVGGRLPPPIHRGLRRPVGFRDRRPVMSMRMPPRGRAIAPPPLSRSCDRRPSVPSYPKGGLKRDYDRRAEVLPPRSKAAVDYGSGVASERRLPYRDEYSSRGSGYADLLRGTARTSTRRSYFDEGYGQRFERPPPSYREGRARDYESTSGSKRSYSSLDDVPPRYAEAGVRHSRARLDYDLGSSASQYGDAYSDRLGRSNIGYVSSRSSMSSQDSHGLYSSRQGMSYNGGSYGGSDVGGMYSSSFGSDYMSRGSDVGGSSYSSLYSSRGMGGSSYMGGSGSGSYY